jgi:hypothetical protein
MKVQMIAQISGTRNGEDWPRSGGFIDLPDDEAAQLVANKLARIPADPVVETADAPAAKVEKRPRKGLTTKDV